MTNEAPRSSSPKDISEPPVSEPPAVQPEAPAPFEEFAPEPPEKEAAEPELAMPAAVVRRHWAVRDLILDYALGNAIVGLNPIPGTLLPTLLLGTVLVLLMMRHIGKKWGFARGQDLLAIAGNIFGGLGAFAVSFMAWLTIFTLGLLCPSFRAFDLSAAFFTFTWMVGQVTHQYYLSGRFKRKQS